MLPQIWELGAMMRRRRATATAVVLAATAVATLWATASAPADPELRQLFFGSWRGRHLALAIALGALAGGFAAAAISRRALFGFALAGVLAASSWVLLELVGVGGLVSYRELFGHGDGFVLGKDPLPDADLSGVSYPDIARVWNLDPEPIPFHYQTNHAGFRNSPDVNEADLYLLGDSILVAALIPFEQTVAGRLQSELGRRVMNVALIGIGPQREQELFRDAGFELRDRTVLQFLFEGNDLVDSFRYGQKRQTDKPNGRNGSDSSSTSVSFAQRSFLYNALDRFKAWSQPVDELALRRSCEIDGDRYAFRWARETFAAFRGEMQSIESALEDFSAEVEAAGGNYAVVFVPSKLRALGPACSFAPDSELRDTANHLSPLRHEILAWGRARQIPVLDLTPWFQRAASAGRIGYYPLDTHWNAEGHAIAAEAIARWERLPSGKALPRIAWSSADRRD